MRAFRTLLAVMSMAAGAARADGGALTGRYESELFGSALVMELRADGVATMGGETARWRVSGDRLVVGDDTFRYAFDGKRLALTDAGGVVYAWRRVGGPAAAGKPAGKAAPARPAPAGAAPAGKGSPRDAQLRQLLLSSAWCSFRYNQHTGTTNQSRAVFRPDGTIARGTSDETYNSGASGTVAGQYRGGDVWRWAVQNERLLVDTGQGLQDVNLQVKVNSAGNPILTADGTEYMRCR
jgi:hypothetical protein